MLMNYENVHLYIAFNHDNYQKADKMTHTLGKITKHNVPNFTIEETEEMIKKRLEYYRNNGNAPPNSLYPLTEESVKFVHDKCGGNPRNIISFLSISLSNLVNTDCETIHLKNIKSIIENDNFRNQILREKLDDESQIRTLELLLRAIDEEFNGVVNGERLITDHMTTTYGWGKNTTIRRLKKLEKFGLVSIKKTGDCWTKTIRLK